jgi:restriction endonuclease
MAQGKRKVGVLGLSFKSGTDDLRCSPIVDVVESLLGKGFEIRIYDKNVKVSELTGTNKDFIMAKIPHLQHFVTDNLESVCSESDVLVVTNKEKEFAESLDAAEDMVCVYAKLPRSFQIPTPVGNYAPDWAIAFNKGTVKHIFFIAETKGSLDSMELRGVEKAKIACAKKLFNDVSTSDVRFGAISNYDELLNIIQGA